MLFKIFQLGRVNDLILRSKIISRVFLFLVYYNFPFSCVYYVKSRISSFTIQIYRQIKAVSNVLNIFVEKNLIFVFQRNHIIIKKYLIFVETENISGF